MYAQNLLVTFSAPEETDLMLMVKEYFQGVGDLAGVTFQVESMPHDRSEERLLGGHIDGDIARAPFVYENDDRAIYTNYPILVTTFLIFTKDTSIDPQNIETFRNKSLVISRGNKVVAQWVESNNLKVDSIAGDAHKAFGMIDLDRVDYSIQAEILKVEILDHPYIKVLPQPLFKTPFYLVLNVKHKDLEPIITSAIKDMAESGRTAKIFRSK